MYIAGPYTGTSHDHKAYFEIDRHIQQAAEAAAELGRRGVGFFCPHLHSAHFEVITPEVPPSFWYELDMHFFHLCQAILLLPGWEKSKGSLAEKAEAEAIGLPVFYWEGGLDELEAWAKS